MVNLYSSQHNAKTKQKLKTRNENKQDKSMKSGMSMTSGTNWITHFRCEQEQDSNFIPVSTTEYRGKDRFQS